MPAKKTLKKTSIKGFTSRSASLIHMNAEPQTRPRKMNLTKFFVDKSDTFDRDTGWCEYLNVQRIIPLVVSLTIKKDYFNEYLVIVSPHEYSFGVFRA